MKAAGYDTGTDIYARIRHVLIWKPVQSIENRTPGLGPPIAEAYIAINPRFIQRILEERCFQSV